MHSQPAKKTPSILELKGPAKLNLQAENHWPKEAKVPLICLPLGMTDQLGGALMKEVLPGILSLQVELLILGKGSADYGALFTQLTKDEGHRVKIIPNDPQAIEKMLIASDMALFFSEPTKEDVEMCLSHAVVPVSLPSSRLEDYNPVQETGNAFVYQSENPWVCFASLVRAVETFKFPYDWKTIQRHCLAGE